MLPAYTADEALALPPEALSNTHLILTAGETDAGTEKRLSALLAGRTVLRA